MEKNGEEREIWQKNIYISALSSHWEQHVGEEKNRTPPILKKHINKVPKM